jgi:hypothetical protein
MSTCNQLTWQTLGSQSVMPKNLLHHCFTHETASWEYLDTWTIVLPLQYDAFRKHKRRYTIKLSFFH